MNDSTGSGSVVKDDPPYDHDDCWSNREWFPKGGPEKKSRKVEVKQGEFINQFTIGASGKHTYDLCKHHYDKTEGEFKYAENFMNGFALVTVTTEEFNVKYKGVVNHNPFPFLKNFFFDTLGLNKPPGTNLEGDDPAQFGKKEIKQLFEVSIKRKKSSDDSDKPIKESETTFIQ